MKPSFQSLSPFLSLFCNCQFNSSAPKLTSRQAGVSELDSTLLDWTPIYNRFARTTQKTQPLYCREDVFTAPLLNDGSYLIVACVFVAAGMCLPSSYLTMDVSSDFTIPAFGRHVTVGSKDAVTDYIVSKLVNKGLWNAFIFSFRALFSIFS
jgi:hypothetical protein